MPVLTDAQWTKFEAAIAAVKLRGARPRKEDRRTIEANVIISASGLFANPKIPQFEGRDSFKGRMVHPSAWPAARCPRAAC